MFTNGLVATKYHWVAVDTMLNGDKSVIQLNKYIYIPVGMVERKGTPNKKYGVQIMTLSSNGIEVFLFLWAKSFSWNCIAIGFSNTGIVSPFVCGMFYGLQRTIIIRHCQCSGCHSAFRHAAPNLCKRATFRRSVAEHKTAR